jgi:hypothetical protein
MEDMTGRFFWQADGSGTGMSGKMGQATARRCECGNETTVR